MPLRIAPMKRSSYKFGLTPEQWSEAKAELRAAILDAAWDRRMTHYGAVASKVSVVSLDPHSWLMNNLLGEIFEEEKAAGRPALTALVTRKDGDKEPGPGFYEMARKLGYTFNEPFVFWSSQVQEVFKVHGKPERSR